MSTYIFLDPDGTADFGMVVVVLAKTAIHYAHECKRPVVRIMCSEGFLVPVGGAAIPVLHEWFRRNLYFHSASAVEQCVLKEILEGITLWKTYPDGENVADERHFLKLDSLRADEVFEGWIPVKSVYGQGVLIFKGRKD